MTKDRLSKANKIMKIISDFHGPASHKFKLLDIGTGDGGIAYHLSHFYTVYSIDIIDQRVVKEGYNFIVTTEELPFVDNYFDIIISNHTIEHVKSPERHLSEIHRVLTSKGICYLATPNRSWPWEVHYRLPLLHYFPKQFFANILKKLNRFHEDLNLFTWPALNKVTKNYFPHVLVVSNKVCKSPSVYYMKCPPIAEKILNVIPMSIFSFLTFLHPTLIIILYKKLK